MTSCGSGTLLICVPHLVRISILVYESRVDISGVKSGERGPGICTAERRLSISLSCLSGCCIPAIFFVCVSSYVERILCGYRSSVCSEIGWLNLFCSFFIDLFARIVVSWLMDERWRSGEGHVVDGHVMVV